jgi:FixJ family two-component response regulator
MAVANEAQRRFRRKVSWGARAGEHKLAFTTLAAPAMTRLRMPERQVLDTLVAGGVARSRAEALKWCVRLVGKHSEDWLAELREAMEAVDQVRRQGPD